MKVWVVVLVGVLVLGCGKPGPVVRPGPGPAKTTKAEEEDITGMPVEDLRANFRNDLDWIKARIGKKVYVTGKVWEVKGLDLYFLDRQELEPKMEFPIARFAKDQAPSRFRKLDLIKVGGILKLDNGTILLTECTAD